MSLYEPGALQTTVSPVNALAGRPTSDHAEPDTLDALHSFADIARELAGPPQRRDTQQRIVALAVKVVGCDAAALSHSAGGQWICDANNSDAAVARRTFGRAAQAVALLAGRLRDTVLSNDLDVDPRWANAHPETSAGVHSIRSALAVHLQLEDHDLGVLTFYSHTVDYFSPRLQALAGVYADHAAIASSMAIEREHVQNLEIALASSREIGAAVGIVMTRFAVTGEEAAFDLLRATSQHRNQKLHALAHLIVTTSDVGPIVAAALAAHRRSQTIDS